MHVSGLGQRRIGIKRPASRVSKGAAPMPHGKLAFALALIAGCAIAGPAAARDTAKS
jgi:hypothetical protein